jgi:hypothetical protein
MPDAAISCGIKNNAGRRAVPVFLKIKRVIFTVCHVLKAQQFRSSVLIFTIKTLSDA